MESKKMFEIVIVLIFSLISMYSCTSTQKTKDLIGITGIDILQNQMNIKWIRTHFNFKENKVYYIVRFCGEKPLCFVTDMVEDGKEKALNGEDIDVVQDLYLWMKLISTLNGKNNYNIVPVLGMKYFEENDRCNGKLYTITKGPEQKVIDRILEESKLKLKNRSLPCTTGKKNKNRKNKNKNKGGSPCQRVCLQGETAQCDEMRLVCHFDRCKCYKRVNLSQMRKKSKQSRRT
ncbi:uncharacterized protein [Clytia hemisphaerica]